uniref:DUF4283 domain-containing protein n=1 Tax=Setaria viridis TaxID=4556 RepID=A0A4U6TQD0_SETVI|nr:hypothetical protein SEVIR_8G063600v2 [Setaria viridis]
MIGDCQVGVETSIRDLVGRRFEVDTEVISLLRSGPKSFILSLPDDDTTTRVYNGGRPIVGQNLRLHVMRWTRFIHSTISSLPSTVDIELHGIPAHLLNEFCWIGGVHPHNADRRDVFRVTACCFNPLLIPSDMDLDIIELPLANESSGPAKRLLTYPIWISVAPFVRPSMAGHSPPLPPANDGWGRRQRRRQ